MEDFPVNKEVILPLDTSLACQRWILSTDEEGWEVIRGSHVRRTTFPLCIELSHSSDLPKELVVVTSSLLLEGSILRALQIDSEDNIEYYEDLHYRLLTRPIAPGVLRGLAFIIIPFHLLSRFHAIMISIDLSNAEYMIIHIRSQSTPAHVIPANIDGMILDSSSLHLFRFPELVDKHSLVSVRLQQVTDQSSDYLIEPLALQIVQSEERCESKLHNMLLREGTKATWKMKLEFHQISELVTAPSLYLFLDPAVTYRVDFITSTNWRQFFRSYSRFLLPTMLLFPLMTLAQSLSHWLFVGAFQSYFLEMSRASFYYLIPFWSLAFVIISLWNSAPVHIPLRSTEVFPSQPFDLAGAFDEDMILHIPIGIPFYLYLVSMVCSIGWVLMWTATPWLIAIIGR